MEKYFIVTKQSKLYDEYFYFKSNDEKIRKTSKDFMDKNHIEATKYYCTNSAFYIVPTENDLEKFNKILCKPVDNNLRAFKKTSKINKAWTSLLDEQNIIIGHKPFVQFYFDRGYGKTRNRLFNIDDVVYCSFEGEFEVNTPEGFVEIKASEFWKIVEDYEGRDNNESN